MGNCVGHDPLGGPAAAEGREVSRDPLITPERRAILDLIEREGPLTLRAISEKLGKNRNTVKTLIQRLQRNGIIAHSAKGYILASTAEVTIHPSPSAMASSPASHLPSPATVTPPPLDAEWRKRMADPNYPPARFVADILWGDRTFGQVLFDEIEEWRGEVDEAPSRFAARVGLTPQGFLNWQQTGKIPPGIPADVLWRLLAALATRRREIAVRWLGEPLGGTVDGFTLRFQCPACETSQLTVDFMSRLWSCGRFGCPLGARTAVCFGQEFSPSNPYPGDLLELGKELRPYLKRAEDHGDESSAVRK